MNLAKITKAIWTHLQTEPDDQTALDPVLLVHLNAVRKEAEGRLDFELSKKFGYLTVPVGGASWVTMKDSFADGAPTGADILVKNMLQTQLYDTNSSSWCNIVQRTTNNILTARRDASYEGTEFIPFTGRAVIERRGGRLIFEDDTVTRQIRVWCDTWLSDWEDTADTTENPDFFIQHCYPYLIWATVLSINKTEQTFVNRAEGNLTEAAIRTAVDSAWGSLELWNGMMHNSSNDGIHE